MKLKKRVVLLLLGVLLMVGCTAEEDVVLETLHIDSRINRIDDVDEKGMAAFNADGKWGYLHVDKGIVIEADYDQVSPYYIGYTVLVKDGKSQLANRQGQLVLEDWIDDYIEYNIMTEAYTYYDVTTSKHIILDLEELEPPYTYPDSEFGGWDLGRYRYHVVGNKGNLYDKETKKLVFDDYYVTLREVYAIEKEEDTYRYFIMENKDGLGFSEVVDGEAKTIVYGSFRGGKLFGETETIVMGDGEKRQLFDFDGNLLFDADGIERQMSYEVSDRRIAFKENGKWGFLDAVTGEVSIEQSYHEARDFHNGYAVVYIDRYQIGIINTEGRLLVVNDDE